MEVLQQLIRTLDPIELGFASPEMLAMGYAGLPGVGIMPDLAGPIVLLRRQVYPGTVGDWHIAGTAHPDAVTIANCPGCTHGANTGWEYTACRMYGNGYCGDWATPVRVDFDGAGDIVSPGLPTWPRDVVARPIAAGEYRITWSYYPQGQTLTPTDFAVYAGADPASIDYNTPIGTVTYDAQAYAYEYETSEAYGDQTPHAFAVRARNATSVTEKNEYTTETVKAEAGTPTAATIAMARQRRAGR